MHIEVSPDGQLSSDGLGDFRQLQLLPSSFMSFFFLFSPLGMFFCFVARLWCSYVETVLGWIYLHPEQQPPNLLPLFIFSSFVCE
jgi:hypothetical protein